jgi:hypothetical protein
MSTNTRHRDTVATSARQLIAALALAGAILLATVAWYGEQRYRDCLYLNIGTTQAENTGVSIGEIGGGVHQSVGRLDCSRMPF